jgi:hAT family C-terminal dimerisation region
MVDSPEWRGLAPCKCKDGTEVKGIIEQDFFWECGRDLLRVMEPLVKVLRLADGDGSIFWLHFFLQLNLQRMNNHFIYEYFETGIWWDMRGGAVSVLQKLAIKLLSQPTISLACEKNWSAF